VHAVPESYRTKREADTAVARHPERREAPDDGAPGDRALGDRALGDRALGDRVLGDRALGGRVLDDRVLDDRVLDDRVLDDRVLDDRVLDDDAAPLFSVGQVAQLVGLRPWFLRRLDSMGVVTPTRSGGDHRRYSRADIRRLLAARALMHDGVSVAGVRYVFELEKRVAELEDALRAVRTPGTRRSRNAAARQPVREHESSCDPGAGRRSSRRREES
jgi:MerR family transcriptional regulator/heat shock protein HspR